MSDVTRILSQIEAGDPRTELLLPLVYEELRKLAAAKLMHEKPGQTLQATALVHEAYLRLVGGEHPHPGPLPEGEGSGKLWNSRGHFFGAAAEAMRRILVEQSRRKEAQKRRWRLPANWITRRTRGRGRPIVGFAGARSGSHGVGRGDPRAAELVKLRYFAGLTGQEAAEAWASRPAPPIAPGSTPGLGCSTSSNQSEK